jgi:hypothetical protein
MASRKSACRCSETLYKRQIQSLVDESVNPPQSVDLGFLLDFRETSLLSSSRYKDLVSSQMTSSSVVLTVLWRKSDYIPT